MDVKRSAHFGRIRCHGDTINVHWPKAIMNSLDVGLVNTASTHKSDMCKTVSDELVSVAARSVC